MIQNTRTGGTTPPTGPTVPNNINIGSQYPPYIPPIGGTPYLSKDDPNSPNYGSKHPKQTVDISSEAGLDEESDGTVHTDTAAYGAIVLTMLASAAVIIAARKRRQK